MTRGAPRPECRKPDDAIDAVDTAADPEPLANVGEHSTALPPRVPLRDLFVAFSGIGLSGFGGAMPWAWRALVEQRRWLSSTEFTSLVGVCQFLPGPNILNVAIGVGRRFHGITGAAVAASGLILGPFVVTLALAVLYERYGALPVVRSALLGVSAVGAGMLLTMGLRMAVDLRARPLLLGVAAVMWLAIVAWRLPLVAVTLALLPVSVAIAARPRR